MNLTEMYQVFCRFCPKRFERETIEAAIAEVTAHEKEAHQEKMEMESSCGR